MCIVHTQTEGWGPKDKKVPIRCFPVSMGALVLLNRMGQGNTNVLSISFYIFVIILARTAASDCISSSRTIMKRCQFV